MTAAYELPASTRAERLGEKQVYLAASGDLRPSANKNCWPAQHAMELAVGEALKSLGWGVERAHPFKADEGHGFIASQREGIETFRRLDPAAPILIAEAVWQYSHHVLPGLTTHRGPILTLANWSGAWPGLVGMLNLNASLTKAGVEYSTLWAEDFTDEAFRRQLAQWLQAGRLEHPADHVRPFAASMAAEAEQKLGLALAEQLRREKAILGVFDEGCMGMFNAIIPDHLLHATGVFKERLSQSALYHETLQTPDDQAAAVRKWMEDRGAEFQTGPNHADDLTDDQIHLQCKMYVAALRLADDFGCDAIGIQYQQGLKDLLPASDLVEGALNNADRPPVTSRDGSRVLYEGEPLPHFNEVDEGAGLDALMTYRLHRAMGQPVESTLHDIRWGAYDPTGSTDEFVWVLEISGAVPPAHLTGGWSGVTSMRQPPMYFPSGGGTIRGVSHPGEVVWSRVYVEADRLKIDIGRAEALELPAEETERRWKETTPQWPMMHAVTYGVSRDQMMARHKSNHIQVAYANSPEEADRAALAKAAMAEALGMEVALCGCRKGGRAWGE
ncbi:fucose isomerase [Botrimarina sp.]|uniref:fucose isomerase n=1 Tax=Botrimarina sp. TaxID=2795802 RepID=UPI0032EABA1F